MEIVTEPDLKSGVEAASFVKQLIALLRALAVCDCKLAGQSTVTNDILSAERAIFFGHLRLLSTSSPGAAMF